MLYTGDQAGEQYTGHRRHALYDPKGEIVCVPLPAGTDPRRCLPLRGSGDGVNDVLQYWFGAYNVVLGDGLDEKGNTFDLLGIDDPFTGLEWGLNQPQSANDENDHCCRTLATSGSCHQTSSSSWRKLAVGAVGQAWRPVRAAYRKPVRVLTDRRRHVQAADPDDHRARGRRPRCHSGRPMTLRWTGTSSSSRRAPPDWTTGRRSRTRTGTPAQIPASCPRGGGAASVAGPLPDVRRQPRRHRRHLHGHRHHRRVERSQRRLRRLGAVVGRTLAPTRASRSRSPSRMRATGPRKGLGVFVDDIVVSTGEGSTSFETGLDGWAVAGPPLGSAANANKWVAHRRRRASRWGLRSRPRGRSSWGSASKASRRPPRATP